ncbi:hypothetical protein DTQ13_08690 [Parasaccharibacter sp. TMW 2.1888]|uniref:siphovirus Gp157 family protein n=1 Tax=Parasaccharibacter sp. TMW 2.1888 TaxID=2268025 RepID=UPI00204FB3A9|nr:siphovirus Gp157 family protein [Parasaccharibacter sp. TMW 2.1888]UPO80337.1 hypothetical protein DTQ13_08690 [Parasaccharibacter sp. TMW 2.1888]
MMANLISIINDNHGTLKRAIDDYIPLLTQARQANDILPAAVQLHEVLGQIEAIAKAARTDIKAAIVSQMMADGEFQVDAGPYTASIRKGATRAVVTDEKALREAAPELFKPQPDKVDTRLLGQALKVRPELAGAQLVEGEPTITIKGKTK